MKSMFVGASALCAELLLPSPALGQLQGGGQAQGQFPQQQFPQQQFPQQQFPQQQFPQQQFPQQQPVSHERTALEIGALYGVSSAYGSGMATWLSRQIG